MQGIASIYQTDLAIDSATATIVIIEEGVVNDIKVNDTIIVDV